MIHECLHNLLVFSRRQTLREQKRFSHVLEYHPSIFAHVKAGDGEAATKTMLERMHGALASPGSESPRGG